MRVLRPPEEVCCCCCGSICWCKCTAAAGVGTISHLLNVLQEKKEKNDFVFDSSDVGSDASVQVCRIFSTKVSSDPWRNIPQQHNAFSMNDMIIYCRARPHNGLASGSVSDCNRCSNDIYRIDWN